MTRRLSYVPIVAVIILLASAGCFGDAPRGNPLDPLSEGFENVGAVSGRVVDRSLSAVPGASVDLSPLADGASIRFAGRTGAEGRFTFPAVPVGRYRVDVALAGFVPVTDTIDVLLGETATADVSLDGLPAFRTVRLETVHVSRWWPQEDRYLLEVTVDAEDPDGIFDVAAVWLEMPDWNRADTLRETAVPGRFMRVFEASELPTGSLHALLGHPLRLKIRDRVGAVAATPPLALARVIEATPVALSPQGRETVADPTPVLVWERMTPPFPASFRVDVVRVDDNVLTTVRSLTGISVTATSVELTEPLPPASYFWTVSVVDAFGNRSRSKEAGFVIE